MLADRLKVLLMNSDRLGQLYKLGNEFVTKTGGWREGYKTDNANTSLQSNYIHCQTTAAAAYYATRETTNKINITGFTKVKMRCDIITGTGTAFRAILAIASVQGANPSSGSVAYAVNNTFVANTTYKDVILELDVSAFQGLYYVLVNVSQHNTLGKIYEVWTE